MAPKKEAASEPAPAAAEQAPVGETHTREPSPRLPGPTISPLRRTVRYWFCWVVVSLLIRSLFRLRVVGAERLPNGPAVLCFNHQNWADPLMVIAAIPPRPRLYFFGPREDDMEVGGRNRLMTWVGTAVPFRPGKSDLREATRRVDLVFRSGGRLGIAGEGRIHVGERNLLPLSEGPAYFALRDGVPLVPLAINGTGWLGVGRTIRITVGEPIEPGERTGGGHVRVRELTGQLAEALLALTADFPDRRPPGRFGRWLTEVFNVWTEGSREAAAAAMLPSEPPLVEPEAPERRRRRPRGASRT